MSCNQFVKKTDFSLSHLEQFVLRSRIIVFKYSMFKYLCKLVQNYNIYSATHNGHADVY